MNRYTPVERLCSGYFGSDHRVKERRPGRKARHVKLVPCGSKEFALRALSVYKEIACFLPKHENIVKVKEAFLHKQQNTVYLCSVSKAWWGGHCQTLNEFLLQKHAGLTDEAYKTLFLQLATGLSYLHSSNIAHNALTAFSVIMTEIHNGEGVAKLCDYGFSQLCLQATDDNYDLEEGRSRSLMYALPPEAYGPKWGREFDKPNKAADIFMLGMLFNAAADHSILPVAESTKPGSSDENRVQVLATFLPFPGYGSVPVGKFLHNNPSVDLDRQLFRTVSPDLRRMLRRMALLEPNDRPAPTGIIQMLHACKTITRSSSTEEADAGSFKMPLAPVTTSNRKRRSSSIPFDPVAAGGAAVKRNKMMAPAREWEKTSAEAASTVIRRASLRLSQRARSVSDYLNQRRSIKITD